MHRHRLLPIGLLVLVQVWSAVAWAPSARAHDLRGYELPWRAGIGHAVRGYWYGQGGHRGLDRYALDWNLRYERVLAVKGGTVVRAVRGVRDPGPWRCASRGGYGNLVQIDHGDGVRSLYAHLSRVVVRTGQRVVRGQAVGVSGNSGHSCGPHLHFRLTKYGRAHAPTPIGGYRRIVNRPSVLYVSRTVLGRAPARRPSTRTPAVGSPRSRPATPTPAPAPRRTTPAPVRGTPALTVARALTITAPTYSAGEVATFSYAVANTGSAPQRLRGLAVALVGPGNPNETLSCDDSPRHLMPGRRFTCRTSRLLGHEGTHRAIPLWRDDRGAWRALGEPVSFAMTPPRLQLVGSVRTSTEYGERSATVDFSFSVANPTGAPVPVGGLYVRIRGPRGEGYDTVCEGGRGFILAPKRSFECFASRTFRAAGSYTYWVDWTDQYNRGRTGELGEPETFMLAASAAPHLRLAVQGPGHVVASPGGVYCRDFCSPTYAPGTEVTIEARRYSGAEFSGWGGACSGMRSCSVTMDAARTVTATFVQSRRRH